MCLCTSTGSPSPLSSSDAQDKKVPWIHRFDDPEVNMTMREAVHYHGYPFEEYTIHSEDGYYTTIHRIPYGKNNTDTRNREPVFIMHGITGMSSVFIANVPDKNLAYLLAEEGYDVWLGNCRGNDYSRKHDKYDTTQKEFWAFGWQEVAQYDIPVMIDLILKTTGKEKVHYVGHSLGTTIGFAMLSLRPEYNEKVQGLYALAPVAYMRNVGGTLAIIGKNVNIIAALAQSLRLFEFRHDSTILDKLMTVRYCDLPIFVLCKMSMEGGSSVDNLRLNMSRADVFAHFGLSSTPMHGLIHYGQLIKSKKFLQFDFGRIKNQEKYGQPTPPEFQLSNIKTPVALLHSTYDSMTLPEDVALLRSQISAPIILDYVVPDPKFLHLEFMWSFNIKKFVLDPLLSAMKQTS